MQALVTASSLWWTANGERAQESASKVFGMSRRLLRPPDKEAE
jgi:hypothetical protein